MIPSIKKYAGLYSIIILILTLYVSFALEPDKTFMTKDFVLSDFGVFGLSAVVFNSGIIVSGVALYVFIYNLFDDYKITKIYKSMISIPVLCFIGIGLFRFDLFPVLHWISAGIFFLGFPIILITLALLRYKLDWRNAFLIMSSVLQFVLLSLLILPEHTRLLAELVFGTILLTQIVVITYFIE